MNALYLEEEAYRMYVDHLQNCQAKSLKHYIVSDSLDPHICIYFDAIQILFLAECLGSVRSYYLLE